jgi:hypothetical protein
MMTSLLTSRRTSLAFLLSLALAPGAARAAMAIEGDWVGEDDKGGTVRLTIAHGEILQFDAPGLADRTNGDKVSRAIKSARFSRDGRGVDFAFSGGRVAARLDREFLRVVVRNSLGGAAFTLGRI